MLVSYYFVILDVTHKMIINMCGGPFSQLQAGLPSATLWPNDSG